ncbi:MAG TPA: DUF4276 family protein [Sumerlaeia bacterium]|nr:DUF4276 family protein [Sumerlaeia bacterium]
MIRLHLVVEGPSELGFAREVLKPYLAVRGVGVSPRCVETSRDRRTRKIFRGGMLVYKHLKKDLTLWMKQDRSTDAFFSTMIDLFRVPDDFPGYVDAKRCADPYERVAQMEKALARDLSSRRFVPYIQLHEFEALLLCDPTAFERSFPARGDAVRDLARIASAFDSPELIDDGDDTAPSKRIIHHIPEYEYQKGSAGPLVAKRIGADLMRAKCRHFNEWVTKLETLGQESDAG